MLSVFSLLSLFFRKKKKFSTAIFQGGENKVFVFQLNSYMAHKYIIK